MKQLFNILVILILSIETIAQAPDYMSYQSVIRDQSNVLVSSQMVGMKLSILQGSVSGTTVYAETHNTTTNINGLVSIEIGNGTVLTGSFNSIDWSNGPYFIKAETDPTGGSSYSIVGTSQLLSVPYALYANTSGNQIWSKSGPNAYYDTGNIGIGTSAPSSTLEIMPINNTGAAILLNSGNLSSSVAHKFRTFKTSNNQYSEGELRLYNTNKFVFTNGFWPNSTDLVTIELSNGNVGIGQPSTAFNPINSKLQVKGGDVYIEDIATGVIMTSPNGQCWRITVDNSGALISNSITCP